MDFTSANAHTVHTATGYRLAQDTGIVPTQIAAADSNAVIWSLMQFVLLAGKTPVPFNPDMPASYKTLLYAMVDLFYPLHREVVMHCPASAWNPNTVFPWTTWEQAPAKTVAAQMDEAVTELGSWGTLGAVIGAPSATLSVANMPPHAHAIPPVYDPDESETVVLGGARAEGTPNESLTTGSAGGVSGAAESFSIIQPTQITIRWIRTA